MSSKLQRRKSDIGTLGNKGTDLNLHTCSSFGSGKLYQAPHPGLLPNLYNPPGYSSTVCQEHVQNEESHDYALNRRASNTSLETGSSLPASPFTSPMSVFSSVPVSPEEPKMPLNKEGNVSPTKTDQLKHSPVHTILGSGEFHTGELHPHHLRDKFMQWIPPDSAQPTTVEEGRAQWFNYENFKESMYSKLLHHRGQTATPPTVGSGIHTLDQFHQQPPGSDTKSGEQSSTS